MFPFVPLLPASLLAFNLQASSPAIEFSASKIHLAQPVSAQLLARRTRRRRPVPQRRGSGRREFMAFEHTPASGLPESAVANGHLPTQL